MDAAHHQAVWLFAAAAFVALLVALVVLYRRLAARGELEEAERVLRAEIDELDRR